ncbi:MAG: hypothetical protein ACK4RK_01315 [Gemmataceae bacterium]
MHLKFFRVGALVLIMMTSYSHSAQAEIQLPFLHQAKGPVHQLTAIQQMQVALPAPHPAYAPPAPVPPPLVYAPPPLAYACPMTICEFVHTFKPTPGCHEVMLIHPVKKCPVCVKFSLPPGCPRMCAGKREIVFDYGCCQKVRIHFKLFCGKVAVHYN